MLFVSGYEQRRHAHFKLVLHERQYIEGESSLAFSLKLVNDMSGFIEQSKTMGEIALLKSFRAWVRDKLVDLSNE